MQWFAYLAVAGGLLLTLLGMANWVVVLCGWGLCVYGLSGLSTQASYYGTALLFGGGMMVLTMLGQALPAAPIQLMSGLLLLCGLLFNVLLTTGMRRQMREAGYGGKIEWIILCLLAFDHILSLMLLFGGTRINEQAFGVTLVAANTVSLIGQAALILDLLRLQKRLAEEESHEK